MQQDFFLRNELTSLWTTNYNNVVCSLSGGRTSGKMAHDMKNDPYWNAKNVVFVYSNSGKEREETLEFIELQDKAFGLNVVWVEARVVPESGEGTGFKIVNFQTASRNGQPFEDMILKYGIPNAAFPHCSRELKQRPINAYAKTIFGDNYATAIGIRIDELGRIHKRDPRKVYPLIGYETTVRDVREFWNAQPFDLQLKDYEGNCDLCWKKSQRKLLTLLKENPSSAQWWMEMERKYSQLDIHEKGCVAHFHRQDHSTEDLVAMSQRPFIPVTDPFWRADRSDEMDVESKCACTDE